MATVVAPYIALLPVVRPPRVSLRFRLLRESEATRTLKFLRIYRGWSSIDKLAMVFWAEPGNGEFSQECRIDLAALLANGEWLACGVDDTPPRKTRAVYLALTESGTYTFNIAQPFDLYTLGGSGYLAGSFPGGITTVDGVPTPATVRVLYRPGPGQPGDGALVAEVQSAADGSWRVDDLDPALKFDVVGRKAWFNDVIMSNVSPKVD